MNLKYSSVSLFSGADALICDVETAAKVKLIFEWKLQHYGTQVDNLNLDHTSLKTRVVVGGARSGWIDWGQLYDQAILIGFLCSYFIIHG